MRKSQRMQDAVHQAVVNNFINQPTKFDTVTLPEYLKHASTMHIAEQRTTTLKPLVDYIRECTKLNRPMRLNFICTHNSRRSHLAQVWAQVWAQQMDILHVTCYSGGTEATAFNPRAVAALQRAGLQIEADDEKAKNPRYHVHLPKGGTLLCYSKKYDDEANPPADFAAVMTCTEADAACPTVPGATVRISLPYRDPKEADGTAEEQLRYDERCLQIATEMAYVFSSL